MPTRDALHDLLRRALEAAGWIVTDDPFVLSLDARTVFVDLGAEREGRQVAVEVKGFGSRSFVADLEQALGQYILYRTIMARSHPDFELVLAMPQDKFDTLLNGTQTQDILRVNAVNLLLFNPQMEEITTWIEWN